MDKEMDKQKHTKTNTKYNHKIFLVSAHFTKKSKVQKKVSCISEQRQD